MDTVRGIDVAGINYIRPSSTVSVVGRKVPPCREAKGGGIPVSIPILESKQALQKGKK
jgi:hypothetical protein